MNKVKELKAKDVRWTCSDDCFSFQSTKDLTKSHDVIGQNRAIEAIEFGMGIDSHGFNIYAMGPTGVGRTSIVKQFINQKAQEKPVPDDWCYIYNFDTPNRPKAKRRRSNRIEELIQEIISRGDIYIDTNQAVTGQVNGLSVMNLGDYMFGRPSRITAQTFVGRAGVVNIDREAKMSGPIHNKGVLILSGYMNGTYGRRRPISLSASLVFEQLYEGVDGDSASSTELYALLSSLADIPLKQNIAVTGSVNQRGEIQPVGGVSQKVEGFYDICKAIGLTGDQGVIIPRQNVKNLMLREDVAQAIDQGRFHIYPVETVAEGMEILTDRPFGQRQSDGTFPDGTLNYAVEQTLEQYAQAWDMYGTHDSAGE